MAPIYVVESGFAEADVVRKVFNSIATGYPYRHIQGGDIHADTVIPLEQVGGGINLPLHLMPSNLLRAQVCPLISHYLLPGPIY